MTNLSKAAEQYAKKKEGLRVKYMDMFVKAANKLHIRNRNMSIAIDELTDEQKVVCAELKAIAVMSKEIV
jgi:hypothetical protein